MKVLLGLSGGVDSAIAAWILKEQGFDVTCCFMRNWDSFANNDILGNPEIMDPVCPQEKDYMDAKKAAAVLGLELLRVDFIQEYWDEVFVRFLEEYRKGRTPNPDILCNQYIKFDAFYNYAMEHGFDAIATGHYADNFRDENGYVHLKKAKDKNKDQSYFLAQIPEEALSKTIFPLGNLEKPEVRKIAHDLKLNSVSDKKDSTGICFIGERNFAQFLSNYLQAKSGKIVDVDTGTVLSDHQGVLYYTIGQRKGLNITAFRGPWFVCGKDVINNVLYVCHTDHRDWLYSDSCIIENIHWLVSDRDQIPESLNVKFRYRQPDQPVKLEWISENSVRLHYPQGIASVTEGQECVFYDGDTCLGGGVIDQVFKNNERITDLIERKQKGNAA